MLDENFILSKLEDTRRELLDLSGRNRLLNTPRSSSRSSRLEIVDELSEEVYRLLVNQKKTMSFLPAQEADDDNTFSDEEEIYLCQPEEDNDASEIAIRHQDNRLQTQLNSEILQRRLFRLFYDARTYEEEQGVNILYLALGFLKWYEDDKSEHERYAPLILVPVKLSRQSATSRFRIEYTDDEISTNLSLQEKLRVDFGIHFPDIPEIEDFKPCQYYQQVERSIAKVQPRWDVLPNDCVLWFFSFTKFLMYRDLHPETWPGDRQLEDHSLLISLLQEGFTNVPPFCSENENIDRILQPSDLIHVVDADSSQAIVIEEVRRGRNLVIQGPPGTGKSQTIANLIAMAVKEGKKVLFVAEKMAALEVVKRRLDTIDLGDMCLELHSHKANKRIALEDLNRTLSLRRPKVDNIAQQTEELKNYRDKLNRHVQILHAPLEPALVSPYQALGQLVHLRAAKIPPSNIRLESATSWTVAEVRTKRNILADLSIHLQAIGDPKQHLWRGVQLERILPTDIDRILERIPNICDRLDRVIWATGTLAEILNFGSTATPLDSSAVALFGQKLVNAPAMDRCSLANDIWRDRRNDIDTLIDDGKDLATCQQKLEGIVVEAGWETDVSAARRNLAAHGRSWFRILKRDYRYAQATLSGILIDQPPKSLRERIAILDRLIKGQNMYRAIEVDAANQKIGQCAFGYFWKGANSDWSQLECIAHWEAECRQANIPTNFRSVMATVDDLDEIANLVKKIALDLKPMVKEVQSLFKELQLDLYAAFGMKDLRLVPLSWIRDWLEAARAGSESLTKWIAYFSRWRKLGTEGLQPLADQINKGLIPASQVVDRFDMTYYEEIMREMFSRYPELAAFDGASHEQILFQFKQLDLQRIELARQEVAFAHYNNLPKSNGGVGEVGIVCREIKKKRRHLPIRKLLAQAGHAIQAIKPVFMMSPISIAQFLEPGMLDFDLLLIDEASQVKPVDAIGAIARTRQIVVVGDERQLPPTRFFNRMMADESTATDSEDFLVGDLESILGFCESQGVPSRMLEWHYRSRHHSLITVSNHEFYNNNLFVVPSPWNDVPDLGVHFHHISDGIFDRGRSASNRIEAQAVANAVMDHVRQYPDKTLGVGAFSVAQRDAILDELELRRRQSPELESFFNLSSNEPFFVKNLENIQGDERDVIFISVGYGRDKSGFLGMNFGPLNNEGGERRLNVLITRARERCEVFSSILAEDIDLNRARSRGAQALKTYLAYAHTGQLDTVGIPSDRGFESQFEEEVARAIRAEGFQVVPQVGVAGFYIDLSIIDPDTPGRYILGVECDGASYHASRSARDRDRLRQQVLEDRGWAIHRIWSTDWFRRPKDELRKVLSAIEEAKICQDNNCGHKALDRAQCPIEIEESSIQRDELGEEERTDSHSLSIPYTEAQFDVDWSYEIHDLPIAALASVVSHIVHIEGPIHIDEIARRVTILWGLKRTGHRISYAVESALDHAERYGKVQRDGLFFSSSNQQNILIRNRSNVSSATLKKPEYLPPIEIRKAVASIVATHMGVKKDEAVIEVARLLGFKSTSGRLREVIEEEVTYMCREDFLEERNGTLHENRVSVHMFK